MVGVLYKGVMDDRFPPQDPSEGIRHHLPVAAQARENGEADLRLAKLGLGELATTASDDQVAEFLGRLLPATRSGRNMGSALLPWICDRLQSPRSIEAYGRDLAAFQRHMELNGIGLLDVTGDDVRLYKRALTEAGNAPATVARALSALRGTYEQFGKKNLVPWDRVQDIQAVESPRVEKNTTPALSRDEAVALLHIPDLQTLAGLRDHAMIFVYFKTACRLSALANAMVGHIERTDTDYYLAVTEKGGKRQRKALLESAGAVLKYLEAAGISGDLEGPLFRPMDRKKRGFVRKQLHRSSVWHIIKRHAREAGIDVDRLGGRGVGVHSLRKTALTNALQNGAPIEKVQQLAGHSDIRTTQLYYEASGKDAEDAARHIQIR